ncbi:MAG: DJ-1/PfpI family protein [Lachnospiraceae bacterium]|jgi:putative intracellular protease/amidase|nr:DJ-1/PfpI family protein [Lachnospiraceae bacterium]
MGKVYVFLADGFEEIEALASVDLLRRAQVEVVTVGVTGPVVTGSHGVRVEADVDGADWGRDGAGRGSDVYGEAGAPVREMGGAAGGATVGAIGASGGSGAPGASAEGIPAGHGFGLPQDAAMVMLPGGGKGTDNLMESALVADVLGEASRRGIYIAAICAAPTVLHRYGLLEGRRVTAFPSVLCELTGAIVAGGPVQTDGTIITGRSAGVAWDFAHALVTAMAGKEKADDTLAKIYP